MRAFQVSLGKIAAPFFAIIYFDKSKALSKRKGVSHLFVEDDFGSSSSTTPKLTVVYILRKKTDSNKRTEIRHYLQ